MNLYRAVMDSLTTIDQRPKTEQTQRPTAADPPPPVKQEPRRERRLRPDRRRRQEAFNGPDRRKRRHRRQPLLLDPRTGEEAALEDRRGRLLYAQA